MSHRPYGTMENKGRLLGWNTEMINIDKAGEARGHRHGRHAKNFGVYPGSHKKARMSFKQDSEVTRWPIQKALFGFRVQSLSFLSESMLSKGARPWVLTFKEKNIHTPQP